MATTNLDNDSLNHSDNMLMTGISKSALRWVAASLSLILFTAIVGLSYSIGVSDAEKGAIPIIRADGRAVKVRPENPGGRQYPHQDLTIYNSFRDDIAQKDVQLKETSEKPISLDTSLQTKAMISEDTEAPDDIKLTTVSETIPNIIKDTPETHKPLIIAAKPLKKELVIQPQKTSFVPKEITPPKKSVTTNKGAFLQIGAFRSKSDALSAVQHAKRKFSELSSLSHIIVKADLGAKGTYYRLRVGPFKSKQASLNSCTRLKAKGQACLYVFQ
ncbi:MAG: cell division protein FtsN [Alphaproteobacteria bacterium]|jgi:cell division protein FtsN